MPKIDILSVPMKCGSDYPAPYDRPLAGRRVCDAMKAGGGTDFVANHVVLPPGCWSSQRHWHAGEDEMIVVLSGDAVLIDDSGRTPLQSGDIAVFPKNDDNGHHVINESTIDCVLLAIGMAEASRVVYPDIDLRWEPGVGETHRDGTPY